MFHYISCLSKLLLIEIEDSNSALMLYKYVLFLNFLFSQISSIPEDKRVMDASKKGSLELSSNLSDFASVRLLSYDLTHLSRAWPDSSFLLH